jgi:hypothetical protein
LRQDLAARQDTPGDKFCIELDGRMLDNRGVAGELLLWRAARLKNAFGARPRIGRFAGFDLFLHASLNGGVELVLHGKNSYNARVTDMALGTIRSLESIVQGFEERAARLESDIRDLQKRAEELGTKTNAPFEREQRYHQLAQRQAQIEEKLDLTKNQKPSQVESEEPEQNVEQNTVNQKAERPAPRVRQSAIRV